jgi:hypothetical protein
MTAPATIRRPLWHGVQPVAGLWFARGNDDDTARAARLVAAWTPGARALRFDTGDIVIFSTTILCRCAACAGLPLCRSGDLLTSAPLDADEARALAGADIGIVAGARLVALRFADGTAIDPARHLDFDGYALHNTFDLTDALPPPAAERLAPRPAREVFGGKVPPSSAERDAVLDALAERIEGRRGNGRSHGHGSAGGSWLGMLQQWFVRAAAVAGSIAPRRTAPRPQPWRERFSRFALFTGVARLIGRRQARHLREVQRLFDEGNLDEALRNAIPLAGDGGASVGQSFGGLLRRDSLRLSAHTRAGSSNIGVGEALMEHLRRLYRRAFERLDQAGRIDEAAFVLGELLGSKTEALDYLVKHGRAAQAAELALGWDMPPATIVRLLLAAGDTTRAVHVARRDNAFRETIALLGAEHADIERLLRREWGRALVAQGDWLAAVDAVWPLADARPLAAAWLLAAETAGITLSARALVRRAHLMPETLAEHAERIESLADPDGDADARTALAQAVFDHRERSAGVARLAALLLPAVAADRAAGANDFGRDVLDRLAYVAGGGALKADLPAWQLPPVAAGEHIATRTTPLAVPVPAAGLHAVFDAVRLDDGRWLVALGEAGVAVVGRSGRLQQRYATPATRLVISHSREIALALVPRADVTQMARLDLVRRSITDLGVMPLTQHADLFDGIAWTVVNRNRIAVIDTTTAAREVLWQVSDLPGPVVLARMARRDETYYLRTPRGLECWHYDLTRGRRLASRRTIEAPEMDVHLLHPSGGLMDCSISYETPNRQPMVQFHGVGKRESVPIDVAPGARCEVFRGFDQGVTAAFAHGSVLRCCMIANNASLVATFDWPKAGLTFRDDDGHVIVTDDAGRLLDIDLATSRCRTVSVV